MEPDRSAADSVDDVEIEPADAEGPADVETLTGELDALASTVESADAREEIRRTQAVLSVASNRGIVASGVRRLRRRDAAEAFVGSVIFASPLLVEDGVFDIADHLVGFRMAGIPIFLIANTLFVVLMTHALVSWTGRDREESHRLGGVVPTRVVMNLLVSFVVAAVLMTVWGRVDGWRPPAEALARVNVLWTVGSIGAALGDIIAEPTGRTGDPAEPGERRSTGDPDVDRDRMTDLADAGLGATDGTGDVAVLAAMNDQFDRLERTVDDREAHRRIRTIRARTSRTAADGRFGEKIRKYTGRDIAEAFVGSVIFSIPFLVEDGVFDVADFFLGFRVDGFPIFFLANAGFVLFMVAALVYWAGPQDVAVSRPLFGLIPRRILGIAVISFLTAAALMTMWGRVDGWRDPLVAVARISAVWTVASFGAALGDILPGESSGDDINDDLAELGNRVEELVG